VDEEIDTRCTNLPTTTWTVIPPKHAEGEWTIKRSQPPAIQTPPETTNDHATSAGLSRYFKSDCIHFKHALHRQNNVNTGTASLATAGDHNLIWLVENATALTTASVPAALVINCGATHHVCNDRTIFNSIKTLRQPIVIELEDDNNVSLSHHGLVNI
jgi:hypothetical protein